MNNDRIFSGKYSISMWDNINKAKSKKDLRHALYHVCCRLQELEELLCENDKGLEERISKYNIRS